MPKSIILITIILLAAMPASAQISWGIKAGANVSSLGTSGLNSPRLGYHVGAYYTQHIEEQYGWQIGLQYSLQGARVPNSANGRLSYHYINLPLVMKLYFAGTTYVELGGQVAYLLSAQYIETGFKDSKTESVKTWDFLGLAGVGHETDSGGNLGLRFGFGFTNPNGTGVGQDNVPRNLVLQIYVGFKIKEFNE